ncbi:PREDICTED: replication protein A 30 kDa subunit [Propithecus coquereli]|uniref:replication protein A 30 kDa subunit n=1 Tax=Propithecus coquereli TaxID=379532 RepID=UPI00063EF818|nr:PREDICTED: replication protein A 30 kDa subunit [Propithecus coquereli]
MSKSGFGSYGSMSAQGGASGGSDQPSEGSVALVTKSPRLGARIQEIIPCCVNQLLTSTLVDNVFKIRGVVVSQVSIVGIIRRAERARNSILYKIDDMTSKPIEARHLLGRVKAKHTTPLPVGVYAKAFGFLKYSMGAKSLEVLKIRVLEDMNEFTVHILETVNAHMMLDKAHQETAGESVPSAPSQMDDVGDSHESCLRLIRKKVLRLIHECPQQEGKSIQELQTQLSSLNIKAIKEAINYLTIEGHIYSTVDQEHFRATD